MMDVKRVISTIEKKYIKNNLKKEKRIDGRGLWDYREFKITPGTIASAEGSADVYLGDTRIITGLKYEIGEPFPDLPDEGVCTIMAELLPIASPLFERGPPDEQSIELARVVDRGIRHADCIQTKKLCIKEHQAVYILFVDMYVINYNGNLIDCGGVSALTTLINARIPTPRLLYVEPTFICESVIFIAVPLLSSNLISIKSAPLSIPNLINSSKSNNFLISYFLIMTNTLLVNIPLINQAIK